MFHGGQQWRVVMESLPMDAGCSLPLIDVAIVVMISSGALA